MTLRRAEISDASSIAVLSIEVWVGTYLKLGVARFFADYVLDTFTTKATESLLRNPMQHILVSENEEGIVGVVRVTSDSAAPVEGCSRMEISTLYVRPRHHGTGIGQHLLQAAFTHCRAAGAADVWLTTNAQNAPAIAFYLALGFEQIGEAHFVIEDQGYLNNVYAYRFEG